MLYTRETLEGDIVTNIEVLEEMDASELHARRLNVKEVLTPMKGENFAILNRRWNSQHVQEEIDVLRRNKKFFEENQADFLLHPPHQDDSTRGDDEAKNDFWTITGEFIYRHHVEPRVKLYLPREESFLVPLKYIDVTQNNTYVAGCVVGITYWRLLERRWRSRIVRCMNRFHKIHFIERKAYEENKQPQDLTMCDQIRCSEKESKTKTGLSTKNSSSQWKPLVESWKFRYQQQCLAKYRSRAVVKPTAILGNARQNMPVLLVPSETKARRSSAQTSPRSDHWKKDEFSESLQSCSQIHSDASSNENSWCKGNSGKIMGRLEKFPAWQLTKVRNMKEVIDEAKERGKEKFISCPLMSRAPRWQCKRWFWFVCSVHWTRIISISNDSRKSSHGHYIKASRMFLTSSRCSIHLYSGQNGRCIKDIQKFQSQNVQILIRSTKHEWPESWSSMEDPVVPWKGICTGHTM